MLALGWAGDVPRIHLTSPMKAAGIASIPHQPHKPVKEKVVESGWMDIY